MSERKIVLIGGGSYAWAPSIVRDMMLTEAISDSKFVLYDLNKTASDLVKAYLENLNGQLKTPATFESIDDMDAAFDGADYFVITISTGGLDAMEHDIAIPENYGVRHTVGDTSGPGGWARFARNFGVFKDLAENIERRAKGAMILNYTNPMTTLTDVLCRLCSGPVVGLCHGLFENLKFLKQFYDVENEDEISVNYAGLNHFFWITAAKTRDVDVVDDLSERLRDKSFTDLLRESDPDPMGFKSNRELATELFRCTGVFPYLGDRHTCEFFPSYITSGENMEKYRLVRTSIQQRRDALAKRLKHFQERAKGEIPADEIKRSRETAADIIAAHVRGTPFIDVGNVPNVGQIANIQPGTVVETAVRVDRNGFSPIVHGPLPEPIRSFVDVYASVFNLSVEACFENDRSKLLRALRLDPVCSHLNTEKVNEMGNRLLNAHERFIRLS